MNLVKKGSNRYILFGLFLVVFLFSAGLILAQENSDIVIDDLNQKIKNKKENIDKLKEEVKIYETNIQLSQAKAVTLQNQLSILGDQIYKNNLKIEITSNQLAETNLEIDRTTEQIIEKNRQVISSHDYLSEFIRLINNYDQQNFITILTANESFSDFFDQLNYLDEIQTQIQQTLAEYKQKKKQLRQYNLKLNNQKDELNTLQNKLVQQKERFDESKIAKDNLLAESKLSEIKFQQNIAELRARESQINGEIVGLEATVRRKLQAKNQPTDSFDIRQEAQLVWPVKPTRGISAYFHDPDYPFRHIFEHPAIDIRAYQGTPIKAAESGYVAKAKDAGYGYSYIMIIHGNGLSTVYGHVSRIDVKQDSYVSKGQVIGAIGGMPGTRGAGRLTTGPHLHFEVRKDGIPINPLEYLP